MPTTTAHQETVHVTTMRPIDMKMNTRQFSLDFAIVAAAVYLPAMVAVAAGGGSSPVDYLMLSLSYPTYFIYAAIADAFGGSIYQFSMLYMINNLVLLFGASYLVYRARPIDVNRLGKQRCLAVSVVAALSLGFALIQFT